MHLKKPTYSIIAILLAFAVAFSTVSPVVAFAQDTITITNWAQSSSQTGGNSSSGQDGQPGSDGQDGQNGSSGQDGEDGAPGTSGASIEGKSSASIHVQSTVDGKTVVDTQTAVSEDGSAFVFATHTYSNMSSNTEDSSFVATATVEESEGSRLGILQFFVSVKNSILTYVSLLF